MGRSTELKPECRSKEIEINADNWALFVDYDGNERHVEMATWRRQG